jgi:hypothetical protein
MTLGKINAKSAAGLGVLGLLAAYSVYTNFSGSDTPPAATTRRAVDAPDAPVAMGGPAARVQAPRAPASRGRSDEFHPVYVARREEDRPNVTMIDPTLRGDLLAKVQSVALAGGARNLFQFGPPPAKESAKLPGNEPTVAVVRPFVGPKPPPPPAPPAPPPPPPPITLKFYGFATTAANGKRTAYFLDDTGDILIASEGDTLKRRYRIKSIKANSVTIEDIDAKREQPVRIVEEGPAS